MLLTEYIFATQIEESIMRSGFVAWFLPLPLFFQGISLHQILFYHERDRSIDKLYWWAHLIHIQDVTSKDGITLFLRSVQSVRSSSKKRRAKIRQYLLSGIFCRGKLRGLRWRMRCSRPMCTNLFGFFSLQCS